MIQSFADKETELIYNQESSRRLPNTIQKVALRKLMMMDNAKSNDQWRICFTMNEGQIYNVEIVDYH